MAADVMRHEGVRDCGIWWGGVPLPWKANHSYQPVSMPLLCRCYAVTMSSLCGALFPWKAVWLAESSTPLLRSTQKRAWKKAEG